MLGCPGRRRAGDEFNDILTVRDAADSASDVGSRRRLWVEVAALNLCVVAAAAYAIYAGQDSNWDQRNYHIYAVHAWLNGRGAIDVGPSQIQTWLSPTPHLLQYLLIRYLPPVAAGALMGALAGLNGALLWFLCRRLLRGDHRGTRVGAAILAVVLGLTGSLFLSFIGTSFGEYICSLPVLLALIALIPSSESDRLSPRSLLLAGLCLGAACGLKLTGLIYALGMSATLLALWPFVRFPLAGFVTFAAGGALGFAALGGYWSTKMWLAFRSPVFPFFNGIFQSPYYDWFNFADRRFLAPSFPVAFVTYPFEWLIGHYPTNELPFREPRFAIAAVLIAAVAGALVLQRRPAATTTNNRGAVASGDFWLLILFFVFSYAVWLKQFGVQRYALPVELISGIVIWLCLERLLRHARGTALALATITAAAMLWTRPPDWEHVPYGRNWFGLEKLADTTGPPTLYLQMSWQPTSYVIPFFRPDDVFVRLDGNMRLDGSMSLEPGSPLGQRILDRIRAHKGRPIRTLSMPPWTNSDDERLKHFGMMLMPGSCTEFRSTKDKFEICAAQPVPGGIAWR